MAMSDEEKVVQVDSDDAAQAAESTVKEAAPKKKSRDYRNEF